MKKIKFNVPYNKKININLNNFRTFAGNGYWTKKTQDFLKKKFKFKNVLLTNSCSSALEVSALSLDLKKRDEVIIPSYAYPTTASAFARCGYKIKFVDCNKDNPRINKNHFLKLLSHRTKAVVLIHHAGQAEDIDFFLKIKKKFKFYIIEDAAQCIDLKIKNKFAGSFGDFGTISFHESKNLHCGLGGALLINNKKFISSSTIIWERGTNRRDFETKRVKKYSWKRIGSNFYPSELEAYYLHHQLKDIAIIKLKRQKIFNTYKKILTKELSKKITLMDYKIKSNYHMKYLLVKNQNIRNKLQIYLKKKNIDAFPHYEPLHNSTAGKKLSNQVLKNVTLFSQRLIRLPIHFYMKISDVNFISKQLKTFFENN